MVLQKTYLAAIQKAYVGSIRTADEAKCERRLQYLVSCTSPQKISKNAACEEMSNVSNVPGVFVDMVKYFVMLLEGQLELRSGLCTAKALMHITYRYHNYYYSSIIIIIVISVT